PLIPKSNMAMVGLYKIKEGKLLMEALDYNIKNNIRTYNEFQLTDGIMRLLEQGVKIQHFKVEEWYDCGKKEVLLATNAMLLSRMKKQADLKFPNTIIIHPV